jgi:PAS domain S-box-containing protein
MDKRDKFSALRERAEALLITSNPSLTDIQTSFNELDTYRIELELQNDELLVTQKHLQEIRQEYVHLYDSAPVGYCSIDHDGVIVKTNATLARMLNVTKQQLNKHRFTDFVLDIDQDIFYKYRQSIGTNNPKLNCELRLVSKDNAPFWVQIDNTYDPELTMMAITDISRLKEIEADLLLAARLILLPVNVDIPEKSSID